jgi:hypothetical protein
MRFLSLSFCPEPLLFWEDVERLASLERARLRDPEADPEASARGLSEAAERIYRRYVAEDAEALINLPSHISGPLYAASASGGAAPSSASVFRSAQRDARHLILTDPFPRFPALSSLRRHAVRAAAPRRRAQPGRSAAVSCGKRSEC